MKSEKDTDNLIELIIVIGVFVLLAGCLLVQIFAEGANLSTYIAGLMSALSVIVGHVMGKNSTLKGQKEQAKQAKEDGNT